MPPKSDATGPILVADVGGTNTRLGLAAGAGMRPRSVRHYRNADYADLAAALATYLREDAGAPCSGACVAVAGPVTDGRAELTNHDWSIDTATIARGVGTDRVALINDLEAQGYALGQLGEEAFTPVQPAAAHGRPGTQLVVGIGTGFNAAPVAATGQRPHVAPSEAGHASLPVRSETEFRLARSLEASYGFAGIEEALSGRGLAHIHSWLAPSAPARDAREITAALAAPADTAAEQAARLFTRLLGTVLGDLALIHLPSGGIFLIGGVARALAPRMAALGLTAAFADKGRFSEFMERFAIYVVADDDAALTGCAEFFSQI